MKHIGIIESNLSGSGFEGLRIVKDMGLRATFFTRDLARYLEVPGASSYFDDCVGEIVFCETNELPPLLEAVRSVDRVEPFGGVMTMGEYDVVVAAQVARELALPTVDPEAVRVARNKLWMREACARRRVPMPAFFGAATADEAAQAAERVGLPCVVKPADETSSADVARCTTVREVVEHFDRIRAKQVNTRGQKRFDRVMVEQCVHGYEVSVEVLAEGRRTHVFGVTDKTVAGDNRFVEMGHVFPSLLPKAVVEACGGLAATALRAVGFDRGIAHVEVKVDAEGPKLIEINPRPAGGRITDLMDLSLGMSCLELMVRQYLGEQVLGPVGPSASRGAAIRYLSGNPGSVVAVTGTDIARSMPGVLEVSVKVGAGDEVRALARNGDRLGHVLAVADDPYVASRQAEAAAHEIAVITEATASNARRSARS